MRLISANKPTIVSHPSNLFSHPNPMTDSTLFLRKKPAVSKIVSFQKYLRSNKKNWGVVCCKGRQILSQILQRKQKTPSCTELTNSTVDKGWFRCYLWVLAAKQITEGWDDSFLYQPSYLVTVATDGQVADGPRSFFLCLELTLQSTSNTYNKSLQLDSFK